MKLILQNVRLSFADLYEAKSKFDGDPKFSALFLIDPKTDHGKKNLQNFRTVVRQLEKDKLKGIELPLDKLPIKEGNDDEGNGKYDGWQDMMVITASSKKRPVIINAAKQPVHEGDPQAPFSGCFVDVGLDVWCMDNQWGKRCVCSLEAVRFRADGQPFTSSVIDVANDFEDIEVEEVSADSVFGI